MSGPLDSVRKDAFLKLGNFMEKNFRKLVGLLKKKNDDLKEALSEDDLLAAITVVMSTCILLFVVINAGLRESSYPIHILQEWFPV